jgi:predicted CXXCH cytochrome family protein
VGQAHSTACLSILALFCWAAFARQPGYIDSSVCAGCHPKAAEGYARSGMARSFGIVRAGTLAAQTPPGKFHHDLTEQDYSVSRRNGRLYLSRSVAGYDGRPADVLEAEMAYWIGSGNHARSYLSRGTAGKLVELPLTWYPADGGKWGMSPGYDVAFHAGFSRKIAYGCVFCHTGYPDLPPNADQDAAGWKLPGNLDGGIDCQRCHGPGEAHVNAARQKQSADGVRASIVNPKKLDPERGMEVCLQCHLETTSVRLPSFMLRYGRGVFSYRPGEPLQDFILHFDRAAGADRGDLLEFVGEAYRLRMSACFQQSKGALTCMTCHNPHDIPRGEVATGYYARICRSCHETTRQHAASPDCAGCHMPKRRPADALNTIVSDHFIRKHPAPEVEGLRVEHNDSTAAPYRGEVVLYYPAKLPKAPENEIYLSTAQVRHGANLEAGLPALEALIRKLQPARGEFYLDLADALRQAGRTGAAVAAAEKGVERMPGNWRAWSALGTMRIAAGEPVRAGQALQRAAALAPDEPAIAQALGEAFGRQGKFKEALAAFRLAVTADPDFAEAHNNLGTNLLRLGDSEGAEKALREAVRLRPESAAMQVNLASFLARRGGMPEGKRRFELAMKLNPTYADGHAAYGAALAANREWLPARRELAEAVRVNPKAAVTRHNFAVVLLELNDSEGALSHFRSAVELDPNYYEAHLKLGSLLMRRGERAEAEPHLRKAAESPDPGVKEAASRMLR